MPLAREHENILAISAFQTVGLVRRIFEGLVGTGVQEKAI
jgi:hypothetical protein